MAHSRHLHIGRSSDILLGTGARVGEVCALTYGQLDLDHVAPDGAPRPQMKINASIAREGGVRKPTKTKKTRRPILDEYTTDVLRRRRADWLPAALAAGIRSTSSTCSRRPT